MKNLTMRMLSQQVTNAEYKASFFKQLYDNSNKPLKGMNISVPFSSVISICSDTLSENHIQTHESGIPGHAFFKPSVVCQFYMYMIEQSIIFGISDIEILYGLRHSVTLFFYDSQNMFEYLITRDEYKYLIYEIEKVASTRMNHDAICISFKR